MLSGKPPPRIFITGDAGAGKSTLLGDLAWRLARRFLLNPGKLPRRVPFLIDANVWNSEKHPLLADLAAESSGLDRAIVHRLMLSGHAALLIDSLDEIQPRSRRDALLEWLEKQVTQESVSCNAIVMSARPWVLQHRPFKHLHRGSYRLERLNSDRPKSARRLMTR